MSVVAYAGIHEDMDADPTDEVFWRLLKNHGFIGLFSYLSWNVDPNDKQRIMAVIRRWKAAKPTNLANCNDPFYKRIAMSVGKDLHLMLDNTNNHVLYWSDNAKQALYGVAPPLQLYLNVPPEDRRLTFLESLQSGSVVAGKVIAYLKSAQEYVVHILAYADGRTFYIDDLNLKMYISEFDYPNLEVGSYIRAVYCTANMNARKLYLTTDIRVLRRAAGIKLGTISKEGLPLHYKLSQVRPINSRASYLKKRFICPKKMMKIYNIRNDRIYSFNKEFQNIQYPAASGEIPSYKVQQAELLNARTLEAAEYYRAGDTLKSLKILDETLERDPKNILLLKDRATIYGNCGMYRKAFRDLYRCYELGCHTVLPYIRELTMMQSNLYEARREFSAGAACYMKLTYFSTFINDLIVTSKFLYLVIKSEFEILIDPETDIPEAPKFQTHVAIHDYAATDFDEVNFIRGDFIINCYSAAVGWLIGTVQRTSQMGLLPVNFVQLIN